MPPLLLATLMVGVTLVAPVTLAAIALKALVAAVCAAEVDWDIMLGVTAARAAASAAALSCTRFCVAEVKSKAIPTRKTHGIIDSAKMRATLPRRSRENRRIETPTMTSPIGERNLRIGTLAFIVATH